jgi:hypothetical protein
MPVTKCLADVITRLVPYWQEAVAPPELLAGRTRVSGRLRQQPSGHGQTSRRHQLLGDTDVEDGTPPRPPVNRTRQRTPRLGECDRRSSPAELWPDLAPVGAVSSRLQVPPDGLLPLWPDQLTASGATSRSVTE